MANSPNLKSNVEGLNPDRTVMSRTTLMRRIKNNYEDGIAQLMKELQNVTEVATTCDCWTSKAHRREYIGVTCHWLQVENGCIVRKQAVLCCKELQGSHTFDLLAQEIQDIHQQFTLTGKVVSTTTDNATNFVKVRYNFYLYMCLYTGLYHLNLTVFINN